MKKNLSQRIATVAILTALSLLMFMIESLLPPMFPVIPSVKIGLSNIIIMLAIYVLSSLDALIILTLKCFLSSVFIGNISAFMYSFAGGVSSLIAMCLLIMLGSKLFGIVAVSLVGATVHNIMQFVVASLIVGSFSIMSVVPIMLIFSSIAGVFNGIAVWLTLRYVPERIFFSQ